MKRLFFLAFIVIMVLILLNRQRVFVRDPLASVYRSTEPTGAGAVKQNDVQVYINYSNDVLMMKDNPGGYSLLIQHGNKVPGTPVQLKCIHWMACLTDADQAAILPVQASDKYDAKMQMSDREVSFVDTKGVTNRVQLR